MTKQTTLLLKLIAALAFVSACTKSRQAELPDGTKENVFAISEFGTTSDSSTYSVNATAVEANSDSSKSLKALDTSSKITLSSENVIVPDRLKFMFADLPLAAQSSRQFKVTFTVNKDFVTVYKVVASANELTPVEKNISISLKEAQLISKAAKASSTELKNLAISQKGASSERELIKASKQAGSLLVPIFKYKVASYGVLERTKNELKENSAILAVKKTEFKDATHIQLDASLSDNRLLTVMSADQVKQMDQLFVESKIDHQVMSAADLESRLNIGLSFINDNSQVFTSLDDSVMHIYKITKTSDLNENQLRLLKNNAGNQEIISCQDALVAKYVNSSDKDCVLVLKADLPINYKSSNLTLIDLQGNTSNAMQFDNVPRSKSVGLVEILANTAAKQVDISGALDPNSSIRIADLKGEFFYRRTFEDASNMFLGQTGTSGDMSIVQFELEDKRLVVRNQQSLISYTGQGAKDREEIMSFPVRYIRMNSSSATGGTLTVPVAEVTTKEKAEYAIIDWTQNSVPNASSPLSFYGGGNCFQATSSQRVTGTDMRLATDGVLNFSLSGSYTMKPENGCVTVKDVNSAYWAGTLQFNFNLAERISFRKRKNLDSDTQIAMNISSMAQEAFNFGVFTLADKVTENGTFKNHDGSEKYMPLIHDFRNGRKIKYYIGGLNNPAATPPERRQLMIEATQQVIKEWNATLRYAFRGTSLERAGDYVDVEVDDGVGHLGDLDRNYIWYQELPAENGLLGVAQPAANPRSGTIEAANVIIYSGNSYNEAEVLLAMAKLGREYEQKMALVRQQAFDEAKKTQAMASTKDMKAAADAEKAGDPTAGTPAAEGNKRLKIKAAKLVTEIDKLVSTFRLNDKNVANKIEGLNIKPSATNVSKVFTKDLLKQGKGQVINYEVNEKTFTKKIAELALNKNLIKNPHAFELAVNDAFVAYGGLDDASKAALQKRAQMLMLAVRFDESTKNRPGCFKYQRNDIEDEALALDADPHKNLLLNYKKTIMSTLSHELGHAFGLLHNFKASADKANFEFPEDKDKPTGRNYSSIMDYIADIDMHYAGPGPYDAHALRAAYTGLVDLPEVKDGNDLVTKVKVYSDKFVAISDVAKAYGQKSLVSFTKDTLNKKGVLKYYEQCSDGGLSEHSMCAQFDVGGSASEIVKNKIADYNRSYISKNYAYDKILFGWPQKIDMIDRNINLFQSIRRYLDEAVMTAIFGGGRTDEENKVLIADLINAAKMGYQFFHEVIRTPDAKDTSVIDFDNRFYATPYKYVGTKEMDTDTVKCKKNDKDVIICDDIKVVEARSLYDIQQTRDRIDTMGIGYDKIFAMQFLLQSSAAQTTDDSRVSMISYLDFEQWFMGIKDPSQSITLNTMLQIMSNNLKGGFFAPSRAVNDNTLVNLSVPIEINKYLGDQTAVASVISLAEAKWQGFDAYAEAFKIGRSYSNSAPQDRLNVVRLGQDRSKSDTRVFYATQNGVVADSLIRQAARAEAFLANKATIYPMMAAIYVADNAFRKMAADLAQKSCDLDDKGELKNAEACLAAQTKPLADYVKDNADIAKAKADADVVAAKLVTYLRQLNANEAIMSKELDKDDSPASFAGQVQGMRVLLIPEIGEIDQAIKVLAATPKANLDAVIQTITASLQQLGARNAKLKPLPLFQMTFSFIADYTKGMKAKLQGTSEEITGDSIASIIVDANQLKDSQDKVLSVIETLSNYTGYVDPDAVSAR